jgi:hypothetical protein
VTYIVYVVDMKDSPEVKLCVFNSCMQTPVGKTQASVLCPKISNISFQLEYFA